MYARMHVCNEGEDEGKEGEGNKGGVCVALLPLLDLEVSDCVQIVALASNAKIADMESKDLAQEVPSEGLSVSMSHAPPLKGGARRQQNFKRVHILPVGWIILPLRFGKRPPEMLNLQKRFSDFLPQKGPEKCRLEEATGF